MSLIYLTAGEKIRNVEINKVKKKKIICILKSGNESSYKKAVFRRAIQKSNYYENFP